MAIKIAINGYGRIGRCVLRAIYENNLQHIFKVMAINDLGNANINAHLTKHDTTHGIFNSSVSLNDDKMIIDGDTIQVLSEKHQNRLPWKMLDIDVVFECTGLFTSKEKCKPHLEAGAKKVIISAPGGNDIDATIVYGVNHDVLTPNMTVVSNASCTTNCLAPIAKVLNEHLGILCGLMTTIHAYTNDQVLIDTYHPDMRRARAATQNMIPTKTGAAAAVGLVLPELKGKLDGFAMRVPTANVSVVDLTFIAKRQTSINEVNNILQNATKGKLNGVLECNDKPLVSMDFNHNSHASIFDSTQTRVTDSLVKILSWYDNEWGFSNQMLKTARAWMTIS